MRVFKFGGASMNSLERLKNVAGIVKQHAAQKLIVVASAQGKTTNLLEEVVANYMEGRPEIALQLFNQIKKNHVEQLKYISTLYWREAEQQLKDYFTEVEWMLHDKPVRGFDYYYDQIVCCGELLSSTLLFFTLKEENVQVAFADARDLIRTDNNFRDGIVDWDFTCRQITQEATVKLQQADVLVTQGFIGATDENESTTLGREGSDFSAAIFASCLNAENVSIWKDVDAVMNADPRLIADAVQLPELNYAEIIEMAYYGAQVIHPKTIKPLQNKNIPLLVKSFLDPALQGTTITNERVKFLPAIIMQKRQQVLLHFKSKDFSFIEQEPVEALHALAGSLHIKPNLTQNTAISLYWCLDDRQEKIDALALEAAAHFEVTVERNLSLLTIRNYTEEAIEKYIAKSNWLLEQKTPETIQVLVRENV